MAEPQAPSEPTTTIARSENAVAVLPTEGQSPTPLTAQEAQRLTSQELRSSAKAIEIAYEGDVGFQQEFQVQSQRIASVFDSINRGEMTADEGLRILALENAETVVTSGEDRLTGLRKERELKDTLVVAINQDRRDGRPTTLLALDLDGFKAANDKLGHPIGNQVLVVVADLITERLTRESDFGARQGGDEFSAVFPGGDSLTAGRFGLSLLADVSSSVDELIQEMGYTLDVPISFSAGIVEQVHQKLENLGQNGEPTSHDLAEKLIKDSDETMYVAKKHMGKGKIAQRVESPDGSVTFKNIATGEMFAPQRDVKGLITGITPITNG